MAEASGWDGSGLSGLPARRLLCLSRNPLGWDPRNAWREVDQWTMRERQRSSRHCVDCSSGIFQPNGLSVLLQTQAEVRFPVKVTPPTRAVRRVPAKGESGSWRRGHQSMRYPGNRHGSCSSRREAPGTSRKSGSLMPPRCGAERARPSPWPQAIPLPPSPYSSTSSVGSRSRPSGGHLNEPTCLLRIEQVHRLRSGASECRDPHVGGAGFSRWHGVAGLPVG
jgi:hypothetical protein